MTEDDGPDGFPSGPPIRNAYAGRDYWLIQAVKRSAISSPVRMRTVMP